jgi:hypothetical protein
MKRLISTTAIVTLLAAPVFAQTAQTGTTTEQAQSGQMGAGAMQAGQMQIQASSLIGQRLYIMRDGAQTGAMQQDGATQQSTTGAGSGAGDAAQTAEQSGTQPMAEEGVTEQARFSRRRLKARMRTCCPRPIWPTSIRAFPKSRTTG